MKPDQQIRRWLNRTRRGLIGGGADHEPSVLVEGAPRPTFARRPWTPARMARFAIGFVLTGAALFFLYIGWAAQLGRIEAPEVAMLAEPDKSFAVKSLSHVLMITRIEDVYRDGRFLAPSGRARRIAAFQAGAARAAAEALDGLTFEPSAAVEIAAARAALLAIAETGADPARIDAGYTALARLARANRPRADAAGQAKLALAAAAAADRLVVSLAATSEAGAVGPAGSAAEQVFFAARGEAFAWRLVQGGLAADGDPATASAKAMLASWAEAARFQPLFLLNGPSGSTFSPNHPAELGLRVALAGAASRQFAAAIQPVELPKPPPRRRKN